VAVLTSIRVVLANPSPWRCGVDRRRLLVIGSLPFFLGLTIVMPILGHATWHFIAVRSNGPNPHPDYRPRERTRRYAAISVVAVSARR